MSYVLLKADRSSYSNESKGKNVFGAIVAEGSDVVVCYVPNQRMADVVLYALNNENPLRDSVLNLLGVFDTPAVKLRLSHQWNNFVEEVVKQARQAVNDGKPLYVD